VRLLAFEVYAAVVTAVHVVPLSVLTYILSFVAEPSERRYSEPFAADSVGAPLPKKMPKLAVLESRKPAPVTPPAGIALLHWA
jgi:hypothetical protein